MICVTQPRRVAAISIAKRVAEERGCSIGTAIGYKVRYDACSSPSQTRVLYVTDGMLVREAMGDPLLSRYDIVILDESHERSLQTDILFGIVRRAMRARNTNHNHNDDEDRVDATHHRMVAKDISDAKTNNGSNNHKSHSESNGPEETLDERIHRRMTHRASQLQLPSLKVVVMSATLQVEVFQRFFHPEAATIHIPGRLYPVQIVYTKEPQEDYVHSSLAVALQIHFEIGGSRDENNGCNNDGDGDILIFLPGQDEIEDVYRLLKHHLTLRQSTLLQNFAGKARQNDSHDNNHQSVDIA